MAAKFFYKLVSGVLLGPVYESGQRASDGPIAQFRLERTPDKREVESSSLSRPTTRSGGVAQKGERQLCKLDVMGSIPFTSTTAFDVVRCLPRCLR